MSDHERHRRVFGLDRDRLADAATETAGGMFIVLLVSDSLGDRIEVRVIAVLVSFFVIVTLLSYCLHVWTKDRLRWQELQRLWRRTSKHEKDV